jgi:flagellar biosynthesis component FlhA
MLDFFEMERIIEELAKAYPAQCATTWFKITKNHKPTQEEYRNKVVEYMKIFEYLLATYPQGPDTDKLKEFVKKSLAKEIERVLKGDNKDVERRHKHYVINSPSPVYLKDTLEKVSEQQHPMRSDNIINRISIKKVKKNKENMPVIREEEDEDYQEKQNENFNIIIEKRRRKKKLMIASD